MAAEPERAYPFEGIETPYAAGPRSRMTLIAGFDAGLAARIARDTASSDDAVRFAVVVSGATFCKGGAVTLDTDVGRKISRPEDRRTGARCNLRAGDRENFRREFFLWGAFPGSSGKTGEAGLFGENSSRNPANSLARATAPA